MQRHLLAKDPVFVIAASPHEAARAVTTQT